MKQGDRTLVDVPKDDRDKTLRIVKRYLAEEEHDPFLGSRERRVADANMTSAEAEAHAGRAALGDAGIDASEVDAIFSWALVPDRIMPSNACRVGDLIGAKRAWSVSVGRCLRQPDHAFEPGRCADRIGARAHGAAHFVAPRHANVTDVSSGRAQRR